MTAARQLLQRWSRSLLFIPVCAVVLIVVLGAFRLNGSSVGLVAAETDSSPQLALQTRPGRSDEWRGRTPLVLRQAANDFAADTDLGIGIHDTGVLSDLPVKSAGTVLKPHSWLYFVVDVERAFAIEWWLTVLGPFLGVYALMSVLTRSRSISVLSGLLVTAAPVATWWTVPSMGLSVLYGGTCVAMFLLALRTMSRWRFALAALAGWLVGCFAALLYLPWIVPLALLFGAVALSQLRGHLRDSKRLAGIAVSGGAVFAVGMALYLRDHHAALSTISNSAYPGKRITHSAGGSASLLFDAPMDVFTTQHPAAVVAGTNASEAASGLMLWLPIALVGGAFSGFRSRTPAPRALAATMTVALVLAAWALAPVPDKVGLLLGLTNVQGSRMPLPLTVAGALAAGLYVHRWRTDGSFRPQRNRVLIATFGFTFITGALLSGYTIDAVAPPRRYLVLVLVVLFVVTGAILSGRRLLGLAGACALLIFSAVRVNPLQVGLDPITASPLAAQIESLRTTVPGGRWAVIGLDVPGFTVVTASGVPSATGVSWYADPAEWRLLDPSEANRNSWDRFAYVFMELDESLAAPRIDLPYSDEIEIVTPSCGGALQLLDVQFVVTQQPISSACLQLVATADRPGQRFVYTTTLTIED